MALTLTNRGKFWIFARASEGSFLLDGNVCWIHAKSPRLESGVEEANPGVPGGLPLAYIGNDSRTTGARRVRCGCEAFSIRR